MGLSYSKKKHRDRFELGKLNRTWLLFVAITDINAGGDARKSWYKYKSKFIRKHL